MKGQIASFLPITSLGGGGREERGCDSGIPLAERPTGCLRGLFRARHEVLSSLILRYFGDRCRIS